MNNLKRIWYRLAVLGMFIFSACSFVHGLEIGTNDQEDFFYGNQYEVSSENTQENVKLPKLIQNEALKTNDTSLLYRIRKLFKVTGTEFYDSEKPATDYIKMIVNMALGLTSFISLILVIYAFYLIFFQKGDDAFKKAKKVLTGVAIALVFVGVSRIIVSTFFGVYQTEAIKGLDSKTGIFN